jgi:hypothetical protein
LLFAQWIIASDLATLLFMTVDLRESLLFEAELALNAERVNDFPDYTRSTTNPNVFVAHWTILVENKPVFNAAFAK